LTYYRPLCIVDRYSNGRLLPNGLACIDQQRRWIILSAKKTKLGERKVMKTRFLTIKAVTAAVILAVSAVAASAQTTPEKSLYERLGGVFAISAVVDHFSDALVKNPVVGQDSKNPDLRNWHRNSLARLAGLKFMRTLWVCEISGGPFKYSPTRPGSTPLGLENAHRNLKITPAEFDEVAAELSRTLDWAKVPAREKAEVLAAFAAHKNEVTEGSRSKAAAADQQK